jgi:hypothetical protein
VRKRAADEEGTGSGGGRSSVKGRVTPTTRVAGSPCQAARPPAPPRRSATRIRFRVATRSRSAPRKSRTHRGWLSFQRSGGNSARSSSLAGGHDGARRAQRSSVSRGYACASRQWRCAEWTVVRIFAVRAPAGSLTTNSQFSGLRWPCDGAPPSRHDAATPGTRCPGRRLVPAFQETRGGRGGGARPDVSRA